MNRKKVRTTIICMAIAACSLSIMAQPTSRKIEIQASKIATKVDHNDPASKKKTEEAYLTLAKKNIEQYRKGDASLLCVDAQGKPMPGVRVEINQTSHDFLFGNLVFDLVGFSKNTSFRPEEYKQLFKELFNFAIFPFYWGEYERIPGHPNWQRNEDALRWCRENGITCKGHPLGWTSPSGTPGWLLKLPADDARDVYKARIINNVIGCKGIIDIWDVVNEPVNTIPWDMAIKDSSNNNDYRYDMKGIDTEQIAPWVEQSFKWADGANPDGHYILNEYFTLAIPEIRDKFYRLIKELLQRNTPVKGIGIQAHEPREMWFSPVELYRTLDMYGEFNLPIHITELIPQSSGKAITGWRSGTWDEQTQAEFAEQFYTLVFGHPSVVSVSWWGFSDRNIWLKGGGLVDEEYRPKKVYETLRRLIKDEWMTKNLTKNADKTGNVAIKGFFGQYEITVTRPDGTKFITKRHLSKDNRNHWLIEL